ncbi:MULTISPECIES: hypothetical protein [Bacillus amyloliquefaciens group]|uniref:hypothetical protein n=1 Tax=Bacillus TaxID=1386 RepID=UPI000205974C|nr:hypothetical protein [Bacillus amyloliquefaciens]AIW34099.1 hypothetical protein KS08_10785 [Bacillus subtilis]AEB23444.1 hypothetical protein BAMTA208_06345 [Bacillus amyloliquefaciens TA208]AEK88448.1 hypothetical protein BAXH7_01310 [Bacillus amyloliquefaciens XH7]MBW8280026.1 hypothetical protein [Bacillus amyloliquefaciens]MEC0967115.1 hypothetical protein [Bacillus amyloliquefaciens]
MQNTVKVTFNVNGVEIKTDAGVPQMPNGINADNMIVLHAKRNLEKNLGIDIYEVMNAEHYDDIEHLVTIDKSGYTQGA